MVKFQFMERNKGNIDHKKRNFLILGASSTVLVPEALSALNKNTTNLVQIPGNSEATARISGFIEGGTALGLLSRWLTSGRRVSRMQALKEMGAFSSLAAFSSADLCGNSGSSQSNSTTTPLSKAEVNATKTAVDTQYNNNLQGTFTANNSPDHTTFHPDKLYNENDKNRLLQSLYLIETKDSKGFFQSTGWLAHLDSNAAYLAVAGHDLDNNLEAVTLQRPYIDGGSFTPLILGTAGNSSSGKYDLGIIKLNRADFLKGPPLQTLPFIDDYFPNLNEEFIFGAYPGQFNPQLFQGKIVTEVDTVSVLGKSGGRNEWYGKQLTYHGGSGGPICKKVNGVLTAVGSIISITTDALGYFYVTPLNVKTLISSLVNK